MAIFQVNYVFFYIIAFLVYTSIFLFIPISLWLKRKQSNSSKIMLLGILLIAISAVLFSESLFKIMFPLLNFLTLLFGILLGVVGFYNTK